MPPDKPAGPSFSLAYDACGTCTWKHNPLIGCADARKILYAVTCPNIDIEAGVFAGQDIFHATLIHEIRLIRFAMERIADEAERID